MDKVAVAKANIRLSYDRDAGYFGSSMRGSEFVMNVTEYDRILIVTADGTYRIMAPPEKAWMPGPILHASVWDPRKGEHFVLVYRDAGKIAWGKRVHIERFITNKTYPLVKEGAVGIDFLSEKKNPGVLQLIMVPVKRQKVKSSDRGSGKNPGVRAHGPRSEALAESRAERGAPSGKGKARPQRKENIEKVVAGAGLRCVPTRPRPATRSPLRTDRFSSLWHNHIRKESLPLPKETCMAAASLPDLLDGTFQMIGRTWKTALILGGGLFAPAAWLTGLSYSRLFHSYIRLLSSSGGAGSNWRQMLLSLAGTYAWLIAGSAVIGLVTLFVRACLILHTWHAINGRSPRLGEIVLTVLRTRMLRLIAQRLLVLAIIAAVWFTVAVLAGAAAGISAAVGSIAAAVILASVLTAGACVVSVWLAVRFSLTREAMVIDALSVDDSLEESSRVVSRSWWRVFGLLLLITLIVSFAASLVSAPIVVFSFLPAYVRLYQALLSGTFRSSAWLTTFFEVFSHMGWKLGLGTYLGCLLSAFVLPGFMTLLFLDLKARASAGAGLPALSETPAQTPAGGPGVSRETP